jgi:hypothetical protein
MKAFVITEYEYYPESPDFKILGVVDSEEKAKQAYNKLTESVKEYNKEQNLYEVSYDYKEFEINDLSRIEKQIQFNNNGRDWRKE